MAVLGIQPGTGPLGYTIPTEVAATAFGLMAGIGGAAAQLIAGGRLSNVGDDRIRVSRLLIPAGLGIIATAAGALLLPKE